MKRIKFTKETFAMIIILMVSGILNFSNLGIEGYGNEYYAAGVRSMTVNLKNFFFVSFDPSGFVSIDKPPVGFWLQAISAKIFGFSGFSIIFPQALAGVISVTLIYHIVKKYFGTLPALVSGFCIAVTPIFVATSRNNTIDGILTLALITASYFFALAIEKRNGKYIVLCLVVVGIGFNIKMAEAYLILPAIYITYMLFSSISIKKRMFHLSIGTIALLIVSLSWALIVDFVAPIDRPYVGSSKDNTEIQLILGYNGFKRLGINLKALISSNKQNYEASKEYNKNTPVKSKNTAFSNMKENNIEVLTQNIQQDYSSKLGITRFFSKNNLSDQISWLIPFAILGFIAVVVKEKIKFSFEDNKKLLPTFWFIWFVTEFLYFSFTYGVFQPYYFITMVPPISALVGIGLLTMMELFCNNSNWKKYIIFFTILINALLEILILSYNFNNDSYKIVIILTAIFSLLPLVLLSIFSIVKAKVAKDESVIKYEVKFLIFAFVGLLIAPTVWSITPMFHTMSGRSPIVGLELFDNKISDTISTNKKLIQFLEENNGNQKYLLATPTASIYASYIIVETGKTAMAYGGFSGGDKIITVEKLEQLVDNGEIRYAMTYPEGNGNKDIENYIKENGKIVPENKWNISSSKFIGTIDYLYKINEKHYNFNINNSVQLYDLKTINSNL
ncbi:glycosyltransferase family 39 protein [Clostridium pasteurianum]|uniref:PMT family glycosyltransferase, 4-amino-4-deoxy-L-arabinose transferase n=1 Tax=Clostridium pasteurianum BC1 TaxID=86416 RepID=R4K4Q8_CLOPA|nr:glycosyltransferase family 39 protein [Clostridium pasteurianum]AGK96711.1 PMT family glycosyltransferase, 4-amino-4-deoxy-L-arabinose transferase [Clostridium pasteurianum BC1]